MPNVLPDDKNQYVVPNNSKHTTYSILTNPFSFRILLLPYDRCRGGAKHGGGNSLTDPASPFSLLFRAFVIKGSWVFISPFITNPKGNAMQNNTPPPKSVLNFDIDSSKPIQCPYCSSRYHSATYTGNGFYNLFCSHCNNLYRIHLIKRIDHASNS